MMVDKTTDIASFVWHHPIEALDLTTTKFTQMYQAAKSDISGTALDLAEFTLLGVGAVVEGGRDIHGIWLSGTRELRPTVDK